jgi:iron complex transport system substrate-binding protein
MRSRAGLALASCLVFSLVTLLAGARALADGARIVSLGGAITEILYALGLDDEIVAVDTTSLYPARALKEKPNVGYLRQLSPEGIIGQSPTLILAAEGAGPKEAVAVIAQAAIPMVTVPEHFTAEGILERIRRVSEATGAVKPGECLEKLVREDLDALDRLRAGIERPLRIMFVLSFAGGRPMAAGRNTAADGIIRLAGAQNALSDFEGYKPVGDEAVIAAAPDVVLAMRREGLNLDAQDVFANPAFALTPAAATKSFIAMDGAYLLGFGPRTARAARDLAAQLYPSLATAALPSESAGRFEACRSWK